MRTSKKGGIGLTTSETKKYRLLDIFYRAMRGEEIVVQTLANDYGVTTKSISRDISEIRNFLAEKRDLVSHAELKYVSKSKSYQLEFENFLLSKELLAIIKVIIGSRALSQDELLEIINKLKAFTTVRDRKILEELIRKETFHYNEVKHDCNSVIDTLWQLTGCIHEKKEITISYWKQQRERVDRRLRPIAIMFSDYYFYLIGYRCDTNDGVPLFYRIDRIVNIVEHRTNFTLPRELSFDEGDLRNKIQFMYSGKPRKVRFSYTGPSVQAILDRIATARVIEKVGNTSIIEAETIGTGINMYLLAQGARVKALEPPEFVEEMRAEVIKMKALYEERLL